MRRYRGRVPVLFDSGIRRGADIFRAVALGAQAVLLRRPYMWGLTLALSGYTSCAQLTPEALRRAN